MIFHAPHQSPGELLVSYTLGLLDEENVTRLESHLAGCDECRRTLAALNSEASPAPADSIHLPPSVVANWEESIAQFRGVERAMVREHLAECAECRNVLEVLGLEAALPVIPELEGADPAWLEARVPGSLPVSGVSVGGDSPSSAPIVTRMKLIRLPRSAGAWAFGAGGWAVAAAVIAVTLLRPAPDDRLADPFALATPRDGVARPRSGEPVAPPPAPRPLAGTPRPASTARLSTHADLIPVRRGADPGTPGDSLDADAPADAAHVGKETGWITVPLPEDLWGEPADRMIAIEIRSPRGHAEYAATLRIGDLDPRQEILWPISADRLESGTYQLVCHVRPGIGQPRSRKYAREFKVLVQRQ